MLLTLENQMDENIRWAIVKWNFHGTFPGSDWHAEPAWEI